MSNFYIQKYIKSTIELGRYDSQEKIEDLYNNERSSYDNLIYQTIINARDIILPFIRPLSIFIYDDAINSLSNSKIALFSVLAASMTAAIIGYLITIPRLLNVVKHKSEVMEIFAEIPIVTIRQIIDKLSSITIKKISYKSKSIDQSLHVKVQDEFTLKPSEIQLTTTMKTTGNEITHNINDGQIAENIIKIKKDILSRTDQEIRCKSIAIVTGVLFIILGYYAVSIGGTVYIFNNYDKLSFNLRWVLMRHAVMSVEVFAIREMVIAKTKLIEETAETELGNIYIYERYIYLLTVEASDTFKNYINLVRKLDSDQFCETLSESLGEELTKQCNNESRYSMSKGMQNNIYQVLSYTIAIQTKYSQEEEKNYSVKEFLRDTNWDITRTFS